MKDTYPFPLDFILLIPCYNNIGGLRASLQSIYYPSGQFRVVIVDDGSRERFSIKDLDASQPFDFPIDIIRIGYNAGITHALNEGLKWIGLNYKTKYIARLDCGDLCDKDRFVKQVALLEQYHCLDLVGSWCFFKNYTSGNSYLYRTPVEHSKIDRGMYFRNLFIHPTVMWRSSTVPANQKPYPENFPYAEDYGLFYTILRQGKVAIIPEPLVTCEVNLAGISLLHRKEQLKSRIKVVKHFSKNKLLSGIGILKLLFLLMIPYPLIHTTKQLLYGK